VATIERRLAAAANGRQTGVERGAATVLALSGAPELAPPNPANIWEVVATLEQWLYGVQDVPVDGGGTMRGGTLRGHPRHPASGPPTRCVTLG
jgi:hypothetical protein